VDRNLLDQDDFLARNLFLLQNPFESLDEIQCFPVLQGVDDQQNVMINN
jgi:hypothetical protein